MLSVGALGVALAATGCTATTNGSGGPTAPPPKQQGFVSNDPNDSKGPAAPVPGAVKGGTITVLNSSDFEHLDPARSYVNIQQIVGTILTRSLTTYKETVNADGTVKMLVIGDMATDTGTDVKGDCTQWKYTLKDGLKYEDGTAVTAADVAYGIGRSFSDQLTEGPHYLQNWLTGNGSTSSDYNKDYKGPYNGGALVPPGLTVAGNVLTFTFPQPHCDMPYAAALPMTAAVPQAKDTKADYDNHPIADGPYMIQSYVRGSSMTLVRNQYWDANTDAAHNAYPDTIKFDVNVDSATINSRILADSGPDKTAISWQNVTDNVVPQLTPDVQKRAIDGATQFADYININMLRVTDLKVRQALNTGLDKTAAIKVLGGVYAGNVLNTIESPTTAGWADYNAFGVGPTGDADKAKALLAGQTPALTLCYADTQRRRDEAVAIQNSLAKSGFKITIRALDPDQYYTIIGKKDNTCDMYRAGWGSDWPSGSTIIPPLLDGRSIQASGNENLSYYNNPAVNTEMDRIQAETDSTQAAKDWAALDKKIMTDDAPLIPILNIRNYTLDGSLVGGAFLSSAFGATSLNTVFVKASA